MVATWIGVGDLIGYVLCTVCYRCEGALGCGSSGRDVDDAVDRVEDDRTATAKLSDDAMRGGRFVDWLPNF